MEQPAAVHNCKTARPPDWLLRFRGLALRRAGDWPYEWEKAFPLKDPCP